MDKKYFFLILISIAAMVISNLITYTVTGESYAAGLITVERTNFNKDVKYIQVTQKLLDSFPELGDGLKKADSYTKIDPDTNTITRKMGVPAVVPLTNETTKKLDSHLGELSTPDSRRNNSFYLEYDEKYYHVKIHRCFPSCPAFA